MYAKVSSTSFPYSRRYNNFQNQLERLESNWDEAQAIALIGSWQIDRIERVERWSNGIFALLGIGKAIASTNLFLSFVHPEDKSFFAATMAQAEKDGVPPSFAFRFIRSDGELRFAYSEWKRELDADGGVLRLIGIVQDITERIQAELKIKELNETLERNTLAHNAELLAANKALEEFSHTISDDLRRPIRAILGFLRIIRIGFWKIFTPELKSLFERLEQNGGRLSTLLDNVLVRAKFKRAKVVHAAVNMGMLIEQVWKDIKTLRPHSTILEVSEMPTVYADASMMKRSSLACFQTGLDIRLKKRSR